jgi:hypothetical protein
VNRRCSEEETAERAETAGFFNENPAVSASSGLSSQLPFVVFG